MVLARANLANDSKNHATMHSEYSGGRISGLAGGQTFNIVFLVVLLSDN